MKTIEIYDIEAEKIDKLEDKYDTTAAELIEAMIEALENDEFRLEDYI